MPSEHVERDRERDRGRGWNLSPYQFKPGNRAAANHGPDRKKLFRKLFLAALAENDAKALKSAKRRLQQYLERSNPIVFLRILELMRDEIDGKPTVSVEANGSGMRVTQFIYENEAPKPEVAEGENTAVPEDDDGLQGFEPVGP